MLKRLLVLGLALGLSGCFGSGGGNKPKPPEDPCAGVLPDVPWAHKVGATCSTPEQPVKHHPPDKECPVLVDPCPVVEEPEEPEEPEPVADGCHAPEARGSHWHPKVPVAERPASQITRKAIMGAKGVIGDAKGLPPRETLARVAAHLRALGFCASGPWDDAVAIEAPGGGYEEWHLVGYTDGGWTGSPFKGTWYLNGPPNPPTPKSSTCGVPVPEQEARWLVKLHGNDLDATYQVFGPDFCASLGFVGRRWCPVRKEGHPQREACEEQEYGTPVWTYGADVACGPRDNPHLFRCKGGQRPQWAEVCDPDGQVCTRWDR